MAKGQAMRDVLQLLVFLPTHGRADHASRATEVWVAALLREWLHRVRTKFLSKGLFQSLRGCIGGDTSAFPVHDSP